LSFGNALKNFGVVEEALILALMLVTIFALFYIEMALTYKVTIGILAFAAIFLSTLASAMLKAQKEARQEAARKA